MAEDPCGATITKRLAWLVKPLVVSSHEFSFFSLYFRNTIKNYKNHSSILSLLCVSPYSSLSFFVFFLFILSNIEELLTYTWTHRVSFYRLPSLWIRLLLASCYNGSIEEAKALHFKYQFQNIHFLCSIFPQSNFGTVAGDGNGLISRFS